MESHKKTPCILKTPELKVLGVWFSDSLKFSKHCQEVALNASKRSACIFRSFVSRDTDFLIKMFKTYIRPILEYGSPVWSPYLLKDIDIIEQVQRHFTKRIPGYSNYSYPERLQMLNLDSLELRRIHTDLIYVYKIINGYIDLDFNEFFKFSDMNSLPEVMLKSFNYSIPLIIFFNIHFLSDLHIFGIFYQIRL